MRDEIVKVELEVVQAANGSQCMTYQSEYTGPCYQKCEFFLNK